MTKLAQAGARELENLKHGGLLDAAWPYRDELDIHHAIIGDGFHDWADAEEFGAEPVLLIPCIDFHGREQDLLIVSATKMVVADHRAFVIDERELNAPRLATGGKLVVHPSIVGWFKAGRIGIFIVDQHRAAVKLAPYGPFLAAGGAKHAEELRRMFMPQIFFDEPAGEAA